MFEGSTYADFKHQFRDALMSVISTTARSDKKAIIDAYGWMNKATLDMVGLAGECIAASLTLSNILYPSSPSLGFNYEFNSLRGSEGQPKELQQAVRDMFAFDYVNPVIVMQLLIPPTRIIVSVVVGQPGGSILTQCASQPTERTRTQARSLEIIRRIGSEIISEKKREIAAAMLAHKAGIQKDDILGRDLVSLMMKSNMAIDLPESARMNDEELLARKSS